jgi:ribosome-binding protein aMBF1 (putative translation factor)
MEHQDWTTVVLKRRVIKREGSGGGGGRGGSGGEVEVRDTDRNDRIRAAKIERMDYAEAPKKQIASESLQALIRRRMELKLNQDKADQLCNFPRHTMRGIESRRILPTPAQQSILQKILGIQLKVQTEHSF